MLLPLCWSLARINKKMRDFKRNERFTNRKQALTWFKRHGVTVQRVMTDNGSAYSSHAFRRACVHVGLRHLRTKPYAPRPNGKAERFIQTSLREWAYARPTIRPPSALRGLRRGSLSTTRGDHIQPSAIGRPSKG
jgi:transposase InsO family protein